MKERIPMSKHDPVNHPPHYKMGGIEAIDVIEAYDLNFRLSNVIKYVLRHAYKGRPIEDLEKALFYLQRDIQKKKEALTKADQSATVAALDLP
jgi:hypothetical protein